MWSDLVDAIRDEDTQHATRLMNAKDLKSALAYSMKEFQKFMGKFRYAVTDFPSQVSQKGVLVAATLVNLKREAIPVGVLNLVNKPKIVDKGAVIATCEPVEDIVARPQEFSESLCLPTFLGNIEEFNEDQRTAVRELLQEFQILFSSSDSDVSRCNITQHRINIGNHPPIKQYPRRLPLAKKEEAECLVKEMVDS
ncbi:hypothetical protein AVEN_27227-1 [Araneus ventricosus]|uniref:Peptidase A9 domain-containing protein n=1 Tax=Araneus ventricosus TaxID=182803 RepID=A0A4Y2CBL3_ARAVE|nr:hypothetical protein AVEN_27227-1 [Araneus ventricosus]